MRFIKSLAINCIIVILLMSTVWVSTGIIAGAILMYNPSLVDTWVTIPENKYMLSHGDLIGFSISGMVKFVGITFFPYSLAITWGLQGGIAYTQTLSKSERGREIIKYIKSLDKSLDSKESR